MAAARPPGAADPGPLRVSQLAALIDQAYRTSLPSTLKVVGEVSGFRDRTHWYFDLKDRDAVISCVIFASAARKLGFTPRDGEEVIASGRVEFYAKGGKTTLMATSLRPVGEGALDRAYRALCDELRGLGYFAQERKRPIPTFPRRIAIVTSRTGAALQDALDTLRRRCPAVDVALIDVRVQGEGAAAEIASALRWLSRRAADLGTEAVLLTRGGGSREDLWAFNERAVADAVFVCSIPIVAAIGHETDTTIAELVADARAATPTQGAMRLSPQASALLEQVDSLAGRLRARVDRERAHATDRLRALSRRPVIASPPSILVPHRARLERLAGRLHAHRPAAAHARRSGTLAEIRLRLAAALRACLAGRSPEPGLSRLLHAGASLIAARRSALDVLEARLIGAGPESILRRGYSVTQRADGAVVRSVADVRPGEPVRTHVADGSFRSRVEGARARPRDGRGQLDLFSPGE